jgi:hypothetical protein
MSVRFIGRILCRDKISYLNSSETTFLPSNVCLDWSTCHDVFSRLECDILYYCLEMIVYYEFEQDKAQKLLMHDLDSRWIYFRWPETKWRGLAGGHTTGAGIQ